MADASNRNVVSFRRRILLSFASAVLALASMPAIAQTTVTNTATVTPPTGVTNPGTNCPAPNFNPTTGACSATDTDTVVFPQLTLTKTASAASFTVGVAASYTLSVQNTGTVATTAASTITDTVPAGLTIGTLPAGCTAAGQSVACTVAAGLAVNATVSFVIPVTPTLAAGASVTNTATVSGGGDATCPATARCISSVTTPVTAPQLTITKTASTASFTVGLPANYTLNVQNTGTAATTAVSSITDTIPTGLTIGTLPAGCTAAGQTVTCTIPTGLAVSGSTSFVIPVTPTASAAASVTNTATVSGGGDTTCPATARCSSSVTTSVDRPIINVAKTAGVVSGPAANGTYTVTYTVTVANSGTAAGTYGALTDSPIFSANLDIQGATWTTAGAGAPAGGSIAGDGPYQLAGANTAIGAGVTHTFNLSLTYNFTNGTVATLCAATPTPGSGLYNRAELPVGQESGSTTDNAACVNSPPPPTPALTIDKTASPTTVSAAGQVVTYSFLVTNTGNVNITALQINETAFSGTGTAPAISCPVTTLAPLATTTCTGTYAVTQQDIDAGSVTNTATASGTDPVGGTTTSPQDTATVTSTATPALTVAKTVTSTGPYALNSVISYSVVASNSGTVTLNNVVVSDPLLTPSSITCATVAPGATCVLTGSYTVQQLDVDAGQVLNTATADSNETPPTTDDVTTPITQTPAQSLVKALTGNADGDASGTVSLGDVLTYTVTMTNTGNTTLANVVVGDALITPNSITCASVAPGGTCVLVGTYTVTVADVTAGNIRNTAVVTSTVCPVGSTDPACTTTIDTPVVELLIDAVDDSYPSVDGNTGGVTTSVLVNDTLDGDPVVPAEVTLTPGTAPTPISGSLAMNPDGTITIAPGTTSGTYVYPYTICEVANPTNCDSAIATVIVPVWEAPEITATKTATLTTDNGTPGMGNVGDVITYNVTVTNSGNVTLTNLTVEDSFEGGTLTMLTCTPTTLAVGESAVCASYTHTITAAEAAVGGTLENVVTASAQSTTSTSTVTVTATSTAVVEVMADDTTLRITKVAGVREVKIGDLVRYTLSVENTGSSNLVGGSIVDTPPAGFSYVEGSLSVIDGDNMGTVSGQSPIRFMGLDVAAGETATLVYTMRVGAGVRPGVHVNQAQAFSPTDEPISNVTTAEVVLAADAMIDESLLFGTVFNDRDGDGWQDSAALSGVRVQGGFAPGAYVANSTTVDRGAGPQPEPDASSPLLHGIDVGSISSRQSVADPVENHQVVIRQRLTELAFTNDFVLTSAQGVTVRMDAEGKTTVEKSGEAAKGLNAAEPSVERRIAQGEGGYVVDYVVRNLGIDERGIPGVRIASVEGLLIETDQFGRYHLAGVPGGAWERGRNFILKVDPSTLPAGSVFTTDNPLLRRITPGLPVRFDWGVKLPVEEIEGGTQQVEMELGEVIFTPGSAEVRAEYLPAIEKIAAKVVEYRGGDVVVSANGHTESLAFDRANAVKAAMLAKLPADIARNLVISVRADPGDPESLVLGLGEGGYLLGKVLFDTDKSDIRPEFEPLLDKLAEALERLGGGDVAVIGHTDVRGSHAYNTALGLRRAKSVYEALAKRLTPEVRAKVRVDVSNDPTAPVGVKRK